jgi:hypothetical protein
MMNDEAKTSAVQNFSMTAFQSTLPIKRITRSSHYKPPFQSSVLPFCNQNHLSFGRESVPIRRHALSVPIDGGVLSSEDIFIGVIIGLLLALTTSFLQGRNSQSDFVLWEKDDPSSSSSPMQATAASSSASNDANDNKALDKSSVVFDGDSWKEMSRPENYIFYKRNLDKKQPAEERSQEQNAEKTLVVVALLALFVPIFSIEFFFALSRQVFCGSGGNGLLSPSEFAEFLCSPVYSRG